MAEGQQDGQEKTEEPTAKKKQDAKEKGQVPRSREFNTTVVLMVGSIGLLVMGSGLGKDMASLMTQSLQIDRSLIFDDNRRIVGALFETLGHMIGLFTPYLLILLLAVLLTPMVIGGWSFSKKAMAPKMERISPMKGIKRMFGVKGLMELVKSLAKVALVGSVAGGFIWMYFTELLSLGQLPVGQAVMRALELAGWLFLMLSIATFLIAGIDVPFQLIQHHKQLKMSKQEVKDESKHTEGDPVVKGRIRRAQQEMAMSRMMEEVPKADVIVTNPTHFAIALRYDDAKMRAPVLVAKGADLIAFRIRELGKQNNIPVFEAPPLARALYYTTELNQEIPAGLYYAVAQVLAYVFQLKRAQHPDQVPPRPHNLDIPDEYNKYQA